ncbi:toluene tolerance protein [Stutzerimonas xanthomarina]|uniref:toluene tolerance protein n=1 Tax=Stutzerimonas xanthomarina TaxID=271420 RepID=UPI003AA82D1B
MLQGATLLEEDGFGPKVYQLVDGNMLKLFRRKRLLSSASFRPHSQRFTDNAKLLSSLGVPTVYPIQLYRLNGSGRTAVLYRPLAGDTLTRILIDRPARWPDLIHSLSAFINDLHRQGVYFRSLHLGNIVMSDAGQLGLIDVSDMRIRKRPLSKASIRRNREHFEKYIRKEGLPIDVALLWSACDSVKAEDGV